MTATRTVAPVLAGEEDLLLKGEGIASIINQTRYSGSVPITPLSLAIVVDNITQLRARSSVNFVMAMTRGTDSNGDNVEGIFLWDIAEAGADDGVNIIQVTGVATGRWVRTHRGTVNPTLTAFATGGQASAASLSRELNIVTTVGTAGDSVKLPAAKAGMVIHIKNKGANACDVFPETGDFLDLLAVNIAASLASGAKITYRAIDSATWVSF